jgi:hypothetical protein
MLTSAIINNVNLVFVQSVQDAEAAAGQCAIGSTVHAWIEPNTKTIRVLINVSTQLRDADQPEKNQEADNATASLGTALPTDPVKYVRS